MLTYLGSPTGDLDTIAELGRDVGYVWATMGQTKAPEAVQQIHLVFIGLEYDYYDRYMQEQLAATRQDKFGIAISIMRLEGLAAQWKRDKDGSLCQKFDDMLQANELRSAVAKEALPPDAAKTPTPMRNVPQVKLSANPAPFLAECAALLPVLKGLLEEQPQDMQKIARVMWKTWSAAIKGGVNDELTAYLDTYDLRPKATAPWRQN